ncbi:sugar phosphate nucleotidyltransferase [Cytobacillus sp. Hm23]
MHHVLLSGGSGKRLWPISNDSRSKQFLKILKDDNGNVESMVQRVLRQLQLAGVKDSIYITAPRSQVEMVQNQISSSISLIVEPNRRDTFPAISLAATYLLSLGNDLDEVICVIPVDSYVENDFFTKILELEKVVNETDCDIALIGVRPVYPSEKYGYIMPKQSYVQGSYYDVSHFIEKPNEKKAQQLIKKGALWNCGIFAFKLRYLINLLVQKGIAVTYEKLLRQYEQLKRISFDFEVVEFAKNIVVLPYEGEWKDLGSWNTLTDEMSNNIVGNGKISEDSTNIHLINELEIPTYVLGVSDAVVAASPDGILVSSKRASPRLKDLLDGFEQRPMYEERRWGWYRVLDYFKFATGIEVLTKRICIYKGKNLSYQFHKKRNETWKIISGNGICILNNKEFHVKAGDIVNIQIGDKHTIKGLTNIEFIEIQMGSELVEEDIIRLYIDWNTIQKHIF